MLRNETQRNTFVLQKMGRTNYRQKPSKAVKRRQKQTKISRQYESRQKYQQYKSPTKTLNVSCSECNVSNS